MPDRDYRQESTSHVIGHICTMLIVLIVSSTITLLTVQRERLGVPLDPQPTPRGYTISLIFFVLPIIALGVWFHGSKAHRRLRSSLFVSVVFLFLLGAGLDFFFGALFFNFPNQGATLYGSNIPVVGGHVPMEEFGFYLFGFAAILLMYIWCNEVWLCKYSREGYRERAKRQFGDLWEILRKDRRGSRLFSWTWNLLRRVWRLREYASFHRSSAAVGAGAFLVAWLWKKFLSPPAFHDGFPGYFLFLLVVGVMPNVIFFEKVGRRCINWRAVCFTALVLLPVSLLWEGVLAVPYGWWGYNDSQMIGITIDAFSGLPVEAVMLWLVVAYAGITFYEAFKLTLEEDLPAGHAKI